MDLTDRIIQGLAILQAPLAAEAEVQDRTSRYPSRPIFLVLDATNLIGAIPYSRMMTSVSPRRVAFPYPATDWGHFGDRNNGGGLEPGEWYGIITVVAESGEKRDLNLAGNTAHTPSTFTIPKTK